MFRHGLTCHPPQKLILVQDGETAAGKESILRYLLQPWSRNFLLNKWYALKNCSVSCSGTKCTAHLLVCWSPRTEPKSASTDTNICLQHSCSPQMQWSLWSWIRNNAMYSTTCSSGLACSLWVRLQNAELLPMKHMFSCLPRSFISLRAFHKSGIFTQQGMETLDLHCKQMFETDFEAQYLSCLQSWLVSVSNLAPATHYRYES